MDNDNQFMILMGILFCTYMQFHVIKLTLIISSWKKKKSLVHSQD